MRSGTTVTIVPAEWRWVIAVGLLLILAAFSPYLWVIFVGATDTSWNFMGVLHGYQSGAIHLAAMFQGAQGAWLTQILHTPEPHDGVFFDMLYTFLGQISGVIGLPAPTIFHLARAAASLFMYMALYQLAASIWMRLRTRRIFFVLVVASGGFGWLLAPLTGDLSYLDLTVPRAYPFQTTLLDIHTPTTIGFVALIVSVLIPVFRPGETSMPGVTNGGVWLFLLSVILMFIEPLALVPLIITTVVYVLNAAYRQRTLPVREATWLLWFGVPALPMTVYYISLLNYNPVGSEIWFQLYDLTPPSIPVLLLSLGLILVIALPGLARALRRFEADGDRFMLVWLLTILLLMYLPTRAQLGFSVGLMIPVVYFATRSLEDFWFNYLARRWRYRVLVALLPLLAASHMFVLYLPLRPIASGDLQRASGILLQRDYARAFDWLRVRAEDDVVLASPATSLWLPVRTGMRVVYGHPDLTLQPTQKRRAVENWYRLENTQACSELLNGAFSEFGSYTVRYVIRGPQEVDLGQGTCVEALELASTFGDVQVFEVTRPLIASYDD